MMQEEPECPSWVISTGGIVAYCLRDECDEFEYGLRMEIAKRKWVREGCESGTCKATD